MNNKIYTQEKKGNYIIRKFSNLVESEELKWHKDADNRKVFVIEGANWKLQMDNELPIELKEGNEYYIPKESFHRVIKGTTPLKIKIFEGVILPSKTLKEEKTTIPNLSKISIFETPYRYGSQMWIEHIESRRKMLGKISMSESETETLRTNIGKDVLFNGKMVMLDTPYLIEENGQEGFEVFVQDGKNIKKIKHLNESSKSNAIIKKVVVSENIFRK